MRRLHISREEFHANTRSYWGDDWNDQTRETVKATPACGSDDGGPIIRRGTCTGLLRRAAFTPDAHCPDCIKALTGVPE